MKDGESEQEAFRAAVHEVCGVPVVAAAGELDLETAGSFEAALRRAMEARAEKVVVDLTAVTFMDSSGVNSLVSVTRGFRESGGAVPLAVCGEQRIFKVLHICGLDRLLGVHPDAESAARG